MAKRKKHKRRPLDSEREAEASAEARVEAPAEESGRRLPWKRLLVAASVILILGALFWIVPKLQVHRDRFQYSGEFPGGGVWSLAADVHYLSEDGKPVRRYQAGDGLDGANKRVDTLEITLGDKPVVVSSKLREALSEVDWTGKVSAYEFGKKTFVRLPFAGSVSRDEALPMEAKLHIRHNIAARLDLPGETPSDLPTICWVIPSTDEMPKPRTANMRIRSASDPDD